MVEFCRLFLLSCFFIEKGGFFGYWLFCWYLRWYWFDVVVFGDYDDVFIVNCKFVFMIKGFIKFNVDFFGDWNFFVDNCVFDLCLWFDGYVFK